MSAEAVDNKAEQPDSTWVRFLPRIDTRNSELKMDKKQWLDQIEPRIAALIQSEHVALLIGSGLTTAVGYAVKTKAQNMDRDALLALFDNPERIKNA